MDKKLRAAIEAVRLVEDGMVVGLGSGSTVARAIELLGKRIKEEELEILGVPTSHQARLLAIRHGIRLTSLEEHDVDLDIDGADFVDRDLNLIKGGGGAHTMEKIVASCSKRVVIIVDDSKLVDDFSDLPVPVEVIPEARRLVEKKLVDLGARVSLRMRDPIYPFVTDLGNLILDARFEKLEDPRELSESINSIPGVIENGLFPKDLVDLVIVGEEGGTRVLRSR